MRQHAEAYFMKSLKSKSGWALEELRCRMFRGKISRYPKPERTGSLYGHKKGSPEIFSTKAKAAAYRRDLLDDGIAVLLVRVSMPVILS